MSLSAAADSIMRNMKKVMIGQDDVIELVLTCALAGGHLLLEDVPGTGKTTMAKALAISIGGEFHRVQFTPDLLPSDITGTRIYRPDNGTFTFVPGPVFTHVLLADEINRATPRTQSALLECMEELQVTEGGVTYPLASPFLVIATQNPVETQGTFMLPEAQLDRFLMRLSMHMPDIDSTVGMMERFQESNPLETLKEAVNPQELLESIGATRKIHISQDILRYIAKICEAARNHDSVRLGPSPRAALALMRSAQAYALIHGRSYVIPDDVKTLTLPVLSHRILIRGAANNKSSADLLQDVLQHIEVPTEERL